MNTKKLLSITIIIMITAPLFAQSYNEEKTALTNFLVRMYNNAPFEGVKVVSDYENNYLLSVVLVKKGSSTASALDRIAQVKSARQVSQYLGALTRVDSETIICMTEKPITGEAVNEITDIIKENSIGYAKSMEVLKAFDVNNGVERCYMFYRNILEMQDKEVKQD